MRTTLSVIVVGCVMVAAGCATTWRANVRAEATSRLETCLTRPPGRPWTEKECLRESQLFCARHFLERECALDGLWTKPRRNW